MKTSKKGKLSYYDIGFHKKFLLLYACLSLIVCIIVFALILRGLFAIIYLIPFLKLEDGNGGDFSYLADFLGGLIGVIIGFIADAVYISRWQHLKKYRALLNILNPELESIKNLIRNKWGFDGTKIINNKTDIEAPMLKEIVTTVDGISTFYNLPRWNIWFEEQGNFAREIQEINAGIRKWNDKEVTNEIDFCNTLLRKIEKFQKVTDIAYYKPEMCKFLNEEYVAINGCKNFIKEFKKSGIKIKKIRRRFGVARYKISITKQLAEVKRLPNKFILSIDDEKDLSFYDKLKK